MSINIVLHRQAMLESIRSVMGAEVFKRMVEGHVEVPDDQIAARVVDQLRARGWVLETVGSHEMLTKQLARARRTGKMLGAALTVLLGLWTLRVLL